VKYNKNFLYPLFSELTYRSDWQIFVIDGSNNMHSFKNVPFGGFVDTAVHLRGKSPPKKPDLGD